MVIIASLLRIKESEKTDWLKIRIMCPSGATYLPVTVVYLAYFFLTLFRVRVHTNYVLRTDSIPVYNVIKIL